jgi:glycosyltransferase involved in cell wall biosynthesis
MTPDVSVVMTVRNGLPYVLEAIDSILAQDHPCFELVVVDDGSDDGTAEALMRIDDPRVRIALGPSQGRVAALNEALALARGRYVANLDADDIALPTRLRLSADFLEAHPQVAAVGAGVVPHVGPQPRRTRHLPCSSAAIRWALLVRNPMVHTSVMYRASAVQAVGGYDPAYERRCQDVDLLLRLAARHPLANLPVPLVRKRLHPGQQFAAVDAAHRAQVHRRLRRRAAAELHFAPPLRPLAHLISIAAGLRSWTLRIGPAPLAAAQR